MNVRIVAIGKIKEKYYIEAIGEYAKRLSKFCKFSVVELPEKSEQQNIEKKIEEETKLLIGACKGTVVLLDRLGKNVSSENLAKIISDESLKSSSISFVIGGSNGVGENLKKQANYVISFGAITFPHQLFRVVLCEQIYRAFTINAGLPYHK
ncbi:MAG: 23S rRNA (pseudouridine(1915)-N(3))-methyltransferase RlmH [Clostridia bacterium]|nr:23S rRNA (pseudouridine(1915)-N(3))-methyltransferase RlmH [Clostridia bacterium]